MSYGNIVRKLCSWNGPSCYATYELSRM